MFVFIFYLSLIAIVLTYRVYIVSLDPPPAC